MQPSQPIPDSIHSGDAEAFEEYRRSRSPRAFEQLVRQYADLVYASALRQLRDRHQAEDAAQVVFTVLALKAQKLRPDTVLASWLLKVTRYTALDSRRRRNRRQRHELIGQQVRDEQKAAQMNSDDSPINKATVDAEHDPLRATLDEGIAKLSESERAAVVLRYFQGKSHLDIAAALGIREEAARKRVQRGLEKLRAFFAARGAVAPSLSASGLASAITTHALTSAPQSLVAQLSSDIASAVTGAAPAAASTNTLIHSAKGVITLMAWTKIKTSLVLGLLLVLLAGGGAVAVHAFSSRSHDDLVAIGSTNNSASPSANLATQPANPDPNLTDYTLAPGEVLKRIAKPDRAVREKIWPYLHGHEPDSMVVEWTDKPEISRQTYGGGQSLDGMLSGIAGLLSFDYSAPRDLLRVQLPGDWVVRRTASTDQRMAALESLLQSQGKSIHFEKRHVPRQVLIARGSFHFHPVSESKWANGVNIYADKLGPAGWGGASGDVTEFLKDLGDQIDRRVLNQIEPSREPFQWTYHESGNLRGSSPGPGLERKLDEILANVSLQTGLTFEKATADQDVWFITRTPPAQ